MVRARLYFVELVALHRAERLGLAARPDHFQRVDPGQGEVDFKRIFAASGKAGIQHYFVENDEPKSPFDDLKISYDYVAQLRF